MYITSLYYIVITVTTVGYGDISPASNIERILVMILTIISCGNYNGEGGREVIFININFYIYFY